MVESDKRKIKSNTIRIAMLALAFICTTQQSYGKPVRIGIESRVEENENTYKAPDGSVYYRVRYVD